MHIWLMLSDGLNNISDSLKNVRINDGIVHFKRQHKGSTKDGKIVCWPLFTYHMFMLLRQ